MLEAAANAAHECAEGKTLPWFACIDQCKDFGPYLLVLVVLLLLSTAIEFIFRKLDDLGAALGKEVFGRVKQELAILGTLSFTMFTAVAIFGGDGDEPTEPAGGHHRRLSAVSGLMPEYIKEMVELIHFTIFITVTAIAKKALELVAAKNASLHLIFRLDTHIIS